MMLPLYVAQLAAGWWLVMTVAPQPGRLPVVARGPYETREACVAAAALYQRARGTDANRPGAVVAYECRDIKPGVNDR